jgi:serine-type D-Ala-D-Ala endopeptidase (penicillin-binding protein 7)
MNGRALFILLTISVFIFGLFQATKADAAIFDSEIIYLDSQTLDRGYTVKSVDKLLWLPVLPYTFSDHLSAKVSRVDNIQPLPAGLNAVSPYYLIDLKPNYAGFLKYALTMSYRFDDSCGDDISFYFYDNSKQSWRILPSTIVADRNLIQAKTIFPYTKVAVLSGKKIIPEKQVAVAPIVLTAKDPSTSTDLLTAGSAIVINKHTNEVVFSKNINEIRPIASITKLVTAMVFLDHNPGWDTVITMEKSDFVGGASLWVKEGDTITVKDLFYSLMVGSKNNTAMALVRASGLKYDTFIKYMNEKMKILGLNNSHFVEPTGLDERNVSTAYELSQISRHAYNNLDILKATTTKNYTAKAINSGLTYPVRNTSTKVLDRDLYVTGTKTGWTDEAGYCLSTQAKNSTNEYIALVLGAKMSQNYVEVYNLLNKYLK